MCNRVDIDRQEKADGWR